jgi:hypothetical protein
MNDDFVKNVDGFKNLKDSFVDFGDSISKFNMQIKPITDEFLK